MFLFVNNRLERNAPGVIEADAALPGQFRREHTFMQLDKKI
jgi:hypothetical protein